jgi:hypothetical protein
MAVSEEILETRRGLGVLRPGRRFIAFVIAAVVRHRSGRRRAVCLARQPRGRILPGVSAAGVDLGGLSADEARAALEARYGAIGKGGILLRASIGSTTVPFTDVGRAADIDSMSPMRPLADVAAPGSRRPSPRSASASSRHRSTCG